MEILRNPIPHLVTDPGNKPGYAEDPGLHALLRAYLELVVESNIARMSDEDPEMQQALQTPGARVRSVDGPRQRHQ